MVRMSENFEITLGPKLLLSDMYIDFFESIGMN
jgi:hypothetical protein